MSRFTGLHWDTAPGSTGLLGRDAEYGRGRREVPDLPGASLHRRASGGRERHQRRRGDRLSGHPFTDPEAAGHRR